MAASHVNLKNLQPEYSNARVSIDINFIGSYVYEIESTVSTLMEENVCVSLVVAFFAGLIVIESIIA